MLPAPHPASARNFNVANSGQLRDAINDARNGDTITFTSDVMLSSDLPLLQRNVTINGGGSKLSGNNQYRGFFVQSGTVVITNAKAQGGNGGNGYGYITSFGYGHFVSGGGGGGGGGLGAALFVASGANVTVSNVNLRDNTARGGNGGRPIRVEIGLFQLGTSGGGGGMFSNGQDGGSSVDGEAGAGGSGGGGGGSPGGRGGFGGGSAGSYWGVGGAGLGGAIFVQQGGVLNLAGPLTVSENSVAGGTAYKSGGRSYAEDGQAMAQASSSKAAAR